mmetsp:Transcript_4735/g.9206  ORF Transcript_4735/g.9206 Transcript_4735/m.9206 type:complete len:329 (-) Transcript_4735:207-1193(-)
MQSAAQRLEAVQQMMLQQQGKTLVEFKAGKLKQAGSTVTADPRRGTLLLVESAADGMTRIQWKTRPGNKLEEDLMIIPNDVSVEKVPECKSGRVILVRMRSSNRKLFFWMQEPEEKKDDEHLNKMREAFNGSRSGPGGGLGGMGMQGMQGVPGMQGLGGVGGGGGQNDMQAAIQQFLMQQQQAASGGSGTSATPGSAHQMAVQQMRQMQSTSLVGVVGQANQILESLDEKARANLFQFLPEGQQDAKGLEAAIHSPQLQQGAARLTRVLNSAQYGNLVTSFGLQNTGDMGSKAFIDAINMKYAPKGEKKEEAKPMEEEKEEDKKMETD